MEHICLEEAIVEASDAVGCNGDIVVKTREMMGRKEENDVKPWGNDPGKMMGKPGKMMGKSGKLWIPEMENVKKKRWKDPP